MGVMIILIRSVFSAFLSDFFYFFFAFKLSRFYIVSNHDPCQTLRLFPSIACNFFFSSFSCAYNSLIMVWWLSHSLSTSLIQCPSSIYERFIAFRLFSHPLSSFNLTLTSNLSVTQSLGRPSTSADARKWDAVEERHAQEVFFRLCFFLQPLHRRDRPDMNESAIKVGYGIGCLLSILNGLMIILDLRVILGMNGRSTRVAK